MWTHNPRTDRLKNSSLLLGQQAARRDRAVRRRIREARFAEKQTLETLRLEVRTQIDRLRIEELATGDFIRR